MDDRHSNVREPLFVSSIKRDAAVAVVTSNGTPYGSIIVADVFVRPEEYGAIITSTGPEHKKSER